MVLGRLPEAGRQAGLIYEELYAEPIVRKDHPLVKQISLTLADLVDQPWVFPVQESSLRRQIEKMFNDEKLPLPIGCHSILKMMSITQYDPGLKPTKFALHRPKGRNDPHDRASQNVR
jgi:DNA-binding transcriptional LysR family regulator